jgi:hypothetical protein
MDNKIYVVSVEDTIKYGIIKAAIIGRIRFWGEHNRDNKVKDKFHDGEWWAGFFTPANLEEQLGIPQRTIKDNLIKLVNDNILIKGKFNKKGFDKTNWYRYNYDVPDVQPIVHEMSNDSTLDVQSIVHETYNPLDIISTTNTCKSSFNQIINHPVGHTINPSVELTNFDREQLLLILDEMNAPDRVLSLVKTLITDGAGYLTPKNKELVLQHKNYFKGKLFQQVIQQLL